MINTSLGFAYANIPVLRFKESVWKVATAFTGASLGDVIIKVDVESFFNTSTGGTNIDTYFTYYFNINTSSQLANASVNLSNLTFIANSSNNTDVVTAVDKVSSALNTNNTLNTNANTTLSLISSGIASLGSGNTSSNSYLAQISSTLGTAFASAQLNVEAIATNGNKTYSNVKSAVIIAQPVLLATTLNTSAVTINGAVYSLNSPIVVPVPPNSKLSNNLVITNNNIPISIIYTT